MEISPLTWTTEPPYPFSYPTFLSRPLLRCYLGSGLCKMLLSQQTAIYNVAHKEFFGQLLSNVINRNG